MVPVRLRRVAEADIGDAVDYYAVQAGGRTALRFIDAVEAAFEALAAHPAMGSPRFGHELDIPNLRAWRLNGFPYLVFYLETADAVDVWRVLHAQRDIPVWMQDQPS